MGINLPVLFISLPFALIHSSTCIVEGALTMTKALHKAPCVLIPQRILGARDSPQEPRVCPFSMLQNRDKEIKTCKVCVKQINRCYLKRSQT